VERLTGFAGVTLLAVSAWTAAAQQPTAYLADPIVSNDYLRVAKLTLPAQGTFTVAESPDARILIATNGAQLDDVTDAAHPQPILAPARLLEARHSYRLANDSQSPFSGLLLDLLKDPGKISCTHENDCAWSIRSAMDPLPLILSEHVTVFRIALPWTPEARSLIVPEVELIAGGQQHAIGDPIWMLTPTQLTDISGAAPVASSGPAALFLAHPGFFVEIAFYDKPFCFCKRAR
jgi:hypothetical protein